MSGVTTNCPKCGEPLHMVTDVYFSEWQGAYWHGITVSCPVCGELCHANGPSGDDEAGRFVEYTASVMKFLEYIEGKEAANDGPRFV